jgi:uncharacterized protein (DUF433 family)
MLPFRGRRELSHSRVPQVSLLLRDPGIEHNPRFLAPIGVNFELSWEQGRMASLNGVITRDPEILGGTPVFRGTRVPFQALLDYIEGGQTLDEFLDDFPTVTREAAVDALEHA